MSDEKSFKLINGNCLEEYKKLEESSFDLILTDPPYGIIETLGQGTTHGYNNHKDKLSWDKKLDTSKMFEMVDYLLREGGKMLLFAIEPFSNELYSNATTNMPYNYKYIWLKNHFNNALLAKKAPVSYYEEILCFTKKYDTGNKNPLRKYFAKVLEYVGGSYRKVNDRLGHRKAEHTFYVNSTQFKVCNESVYNELIKVYKIDQMEGFRDYESIKEEYAKTGKTVFNLKEGEKMKSNILKYRKPTFSVHPTQKPVPLLHDLIETYTEIGDNVLDFTMGSGSTGVACRFAQRNFTGIEMNKKYFDIATNRIENYIDDREHKNPKPEEILHELHYKNK